jgi:hypothetical protein
VAPAPAPPLLSLPLVRRRRKGKGHGWLGFRAAASGGFLWGGPRACGAGPDAQGGDARRSCHGHAARIRRLRRGIRVCGVGGRGAGEKGGRAREVTPGCRRAERVRPAGNASGSRGAGEKGGAAVMAFYREVWANGDAGGASGARAARGRVKLMGGSRPSATPGEGKVKSRGRGWWARLAELGRGLRAALREGKKKKRRAGERYLGP